MCCQIRAELIQRGGEILWCEIRKLFNCIWSKKELPESAWGLLFNQLTRRAMKLTVVIIGEYHCYQLYTKLYPVSLSEEKIIEDHQCGSPVSVST
jgi:hypothetical protein